MIAARYDLEREVGRGGMGAVWLAHDVVLDRAVAIKRLGRDDAPPGDPRTEHDTDPGFRRAEREARLAAALNHPHIVAVLDLVVEDHQQWLVMEYVEGASLADVVRREGPLSPDRTAGLLAQVADALGAAHRAGIVHRDVKPSNMMVTPDGHVKLTDFGIARLAGDESLTRTGMVIGSPAYLAPEVVSGRSATEASDVWSLGASCYFALTGSPAYESDGDLMATLYRIVSQPPPRVPDPGWLGPFLEGAMTVQPEDRWPMSRVRDFLAGGPPTVLSPVVDGTLEAPVVPPVAPAPTPPEPTPPGPASKAPARRAPLLVAAALAALAGLAFGGWSLLHDGAGPTASGSSGAPSTPATGPSPSPSPSADPGGAPTAAELRSFVRTYVATATTDQAASWRMLTPGFQDSSGSFAGYRQAWQKRPNTTVSNVVARPADLTVSYDIAYADARGRPLFDDHVTLTLERHDEGFLIAAER